MASKSPFGGQKLPDMLRRLVGVASRIITGNSGCEVCGLGSTSSRYVNADCKWTLEKPSPGASAHMFCGMHAPQAGTDARDLSGDRDIEWSYASARVGRYAGPGRNVLDFGAGSGFLTMAAACAGADVLAVDLMPRQFPLSYPSIRFRQTDVMSLNETEQRFDVIMNCSTIEHVGLAGRYGASAQPDGDIEAMVKLRRLLKPDGLMILTLPVGRDQVIFPLHRVYGRERLPRLLDGYRTIEETYLKKGRANDWHLCGREDALDETATERYYALGTMVLRHETGDG